MAERAMDTRASAAFLRHRWRPLLAAGIVGAALGVLYAALVPIELTSTSLVLLRPASPSSPTDSVTDVDTQVRLVQSIPVLERAGRELHPAMSARQVEDRLAVVGATDQLIQIQASSARADQAQALSQAVADAFVKTLSENAQSATETTTGDLRLRADQLEQLVKKLQDQMDATSRRKASEDPRSVDARRDAQLYAQLTIEQGSASLEWNQIKKDLASGTVTGLADPATIVQPAGPATGQDALSHSLTSALEGAALLGALAAVGLLVRARRDPRLRTRDDLADAVGSTVLADVRSRPQRSVAEWSALFETYDAPPVDAWAFRQVLRSLAASPAVASVGRTASKRLSARVEHPRSVMVVSLGGDRRGLAVGPQLVSFTASLGISTRFVAAAGQSSAVSLWAACSSERASDLRAGLVLEARTEDHDPGAEVEPIVPVLGPPDQAFDELLNGPDLSVSGEDEYDQERDLDTWDASEPVEEFDDDVDEGVPDEGDQVVQSDDEIVPGPEPLTDAVMPATTGPVSPKHALPDLTVMLAVADRREPTLGGLPATAVTVLVISSSFANREDLARLAVAVTDAGRRIDGIIVADPDPADSTTGRRTLDERALEVPLPVRMTGVSQLPLAGSDRGKR